jgi:hypothetical protein
MLLTLAAEVSLLLSYYNFTSIRDSSTLFIHFVWIQTIKKRIREVSHLHALQRETCSVLISWIFLALCTFARLPNPLIQSQTKISSKKYTTSNPRLLSPHSDDCMQLRFIRLRHIGHRRPYYTDRKEPLSYPEFLQELYITRTANAALYTISRRALH